MYRASDDGGAIVDVMRTAYARALRERAQWLVSFSSRLSEQDLQELAGRKLGRWNAEFQSIEQASDTQS